MAIAEITAALGALKATTDLIGGVLSADKALDQAELKFRLADAATSLLSATRAVHAAEDAITTRDAEIARLNDAMEIRDTVVKFMSAYYPKDEEGRALGDPYCMRCWENDRKLRHLTVPGGHPESVDCPSCGKKYPYSGAFPIQRARKA